MRRLLTIAAFVVAFVTGLLIAADGPPPRATVDATPPGWYYFPPGSERAGVDIQPGYGERAHACWWEIQQVLAKYNTPNPSMQLEVHEQHTRDGHRRTIIVVQEYHVAMPTEENR